MILPLLTLNFSQWMGIVKNYYLDLADDNTLISKVKKFDSKPISCLGTGWENKNLVLSFLFSYFFLSCLIVHANVFCRFSAIFIEMTTFEEFEEIC